MLCTDSYARESTPTPPPHIQSTPLPAPAGKFLRCWHPFGELVVEGLVGESDNAHMIRMLLLLSLLLFIIPHIHTHTRTIHIIESEKTPLNVSLVFYCFMHFG